MTWYMNVEDFIQDAEDVMSWELLGRINKQPHADVTPVVHAHWELPMNGKGICSHCHRQDSIDPLATHCRFCGAKMDERG